MNGSSGMLREHQDDQELKEQGVPEGKERVDVEHDSLPRSDQTAWTRTAIHAGLASGGS